MIVHRFNLVMFGNEPLTWDLNKTKVSLVTEEFLFFTTESVVQL